MLGGVRIWDRGTGEPGERAGVCAGAGLRASWLLARSQLLGPPPPVPETAGPRACCCGAGLLGAPAGSGPPQTERFVSTEPLACGGSRSPARCGGACAHVPDTTEAVGVGGAGRRGFETEPACDRLGLQQRLQRYGAESKFISLATASCTLPCCLRGAGAPPPGRGSGRGLLCGPSPRLTALLLEREGRIFKIPGPPRFPGSGLLYAPLSLLAKRDSVSAQPTTAHRGPEGVEVTLSAPPPQFSGRRLHLSSSSSPSASN